MLFKHVPLPGYSCHFAQKLPSRGECWALSDVAGMLEKSPDFRIARRTDQVGDLPDEGLSENRELISISIIGPTVPREDPSSSLALP